MGELIERLKSDLRDEEDRYVYADTVTNAFIAAQIKALREDRELSQDQLAALIGTKQPGVSRLEQSDYSSWKVETLRKLARAFRVRLRIRFEEFRTLPDEITGFDTDSLTPRKFEDDLVFGEKTNEQGRQEWPGASTKDQQMAPGAGMDKNVAVPVLDGKPVEPANTHYGNRKRKIKNPSRRTTDRRSKGTTS